MIHPAPPSDTARPRTTGGPLSIRVARAVLGLSLVTALLSGFAANRYLVQRARYEALFHLRNYVRQRAELEAVSFETAARSVLAMREDLAHRLAVAHTDARDFDAATESRPDGAIRHRLTGYNGNHDTMLFVPRDTATTEEFKRRLMAAEKVSNTYGRSSTGAGHLNAYVLLPEAAVAMHWASRPDWADKTTADADVRRGPQWNTAVTGNALGAPVWTAPFHDPHAGTRLIACVAPLRIDGRIVAVTGIDLPVSSLVSRMLTDSLEGATNMIVRHDGVLVAHPDMCDTLTRGDVAPPAKRAEALTGELPPPGEMLSVNFSRDGQTAMAAAEIPGAGARYVCALPVNKLAGSATRDALLISIALAVFIAAQGAIVYHIIRKRVLIPLHRLAGDVESLAGAASPPGADDIDILSRDFDVMSEQLRTAEASAEAGRESEQRAKRADSILHTIPGVVFTCRMDERWTILFISDHIEALTGYPASGFLQGTWDFGTIVHPEDGPRVAAEIRAKAPVSGGYRVDYRIVRRDGAIVHVREDARFTTDPATGDPVIDGIIHDIDAPVGTTAKPAFVDTKNGPDTDVGPVI